MQHQIKLTYSHLITFKHVKNTKSHIQKTND